MNNTLRNISLLVFAFSCSLSYSQKKSSVWFLGQAKNQITKERIDSVNYSILKNDSVIFKGVTDKKGITDYSYFARDKGEYKIIFEKKGYNQSILTYNIKNFNVNQHYKDVFMRKERVLRAATVTATKIAMVMKGDTIVYDADAFELAEGSMLDALVSRLPGAQLRSGGQIFVNGEKVSKLLVNGRDFFSGDAKVALDNLPSYMVKNIKVFRQEHLNAYLVGKSNKEDLPLVMDVNLKKQYSIGWTSTTDGGVGTDNRWMGRVFFLRFTPHSHLGVYVNANNTSDDNKPGSDSDWTPLQVQMQQRKLITAGFDSNIEKANKKWSINNNLQGSINRETENSQTSGSYFLTGKPVWKRAMDFSYNKKSSLKYAGGGNVLLKNYSWIYKLNASYSENKGNGWNSSMELNDDIDENESSRFLLDRIYSQNVSEKLISDYVNFSQGKNTNYDVNFTGANTFRLPAAGNSIGNNIIFSYNNSKRKSFSFYNLKQHENSTETLLHRYNAMPFHELNASGNLWYQMQRDQKNFIFKTTYKVSYNEKTGSRDIYQLHELGDEWRNESQLGKLPSASSDLMEVIDRVNSYHSTNKTLAHEVSFVLNRWWGAKLNGRRRVDIELALTPSFYRDQLDYRRAAIDTSMVHKSFFIIPQITFKYDNKNWIQYSINEGRINLLQRLNVYDNSNPLVHQYGNENLKRTRSHNITARWRVWDITLFPRYSLVQNAVSQAFIYDRTTGVSTYRPVNVNGNWSAGFGADYLHFLDKERRFYLQAHSGWDYTNSVDYISSGGEAQRSSVRNLDQKNDIKLDYKKGKIGFGAKVSSYWRHMESRRDGFSTINAFEYNYGINGTAELPLGFQFSTDFGVYSRMGYQNHSLNNTDVVWNARLSKSFLKGKMLCYVDVFDILGQLDNVRYYLTTQGTTETRYNVMPRYAMFHLVLRLAKKAKENKEK